MLRRRRSTLGPVSLLAVVGVLTACGDDGNDQGLRLRQAADRAAGLRADDATGAAADLGAGDAADDATGAAADLGAGDAAGDAAGAAADLGAGDAAGGDAAPAEPAGGPSEQPAADLGPAAPTGEPTGEPTGVVIPVTALDNSFRPEVVEIGVGDEVLWENRGLNEHNVLYVEGDDWGIEVEEFQPGDAYAHVFTEPGEYRYYCSIHGNTEVGMVGTVVVTG